MTLSLTPWFSASVVVTGLREQYDIDEATSSLFTILVQVGFVAGALSASATGLADAVSPRLLVTAGAFGAAGFNALLLLDAMTLGGALVLRFLTGASLALVYPPSLKAICTWFMHDRGLAVGGLLAALALGSAAPSLVRAIQGADVDPAPVFVATSAAAGLGGAIAFFWPMGPYPFPRSSLSLTTVPRILRNRGVMLAIVTYTCHQWELYAMWTWLLTMLEDIFLANGRVAAEDIGRTAAFISFAAIASGAFGCTILGAVADRIGRTLIVFLSLIVSGICSLIFGVVARTAPVGVTAALACVWGFFVISDSAQYSAMVTELADASLVGTALALQMAIGFAFTIPTIALVPVLRDEQDIGDDWAPAFLAIGPALGIAATAYLRSLPESRLLAHGKR